MIVLLLGLFLWIEYSPVYIFCFFKLDYLKSVYTDSTTSEEVTTVAV